MRKGPFAPYKGPTLPFHGSCGRPIAENRQRGTVREVIAYLRGIARSPRILDVDGVGYLVSCPSPMRVGDEVELHVHTQVRDDAITLFGFADEAERSVFEALIKVNGVGPSSALALLAGLGPDAIVNAVQRKDVKTLTQVRGVGAKVAEKIVTLVNLPAGIAGDPRLGELVNALTGLGFDRQSATETARSVLDESPAESSEAELLTAAITIAQRSRR